jgi:voltage-gated chloride channel
VPQVLGVGYEYVGYALNGNMALKLMALLVVLKLLTVTTSYASGNAGGIFGPALFIGNCHCLERCPLLLPAPTDFSMAGLTSKPPISGSGSGACRRRSKVSALSSFPISTSALS